MSNSNVLEKVYSTLLNLNIIENKVEENADLYMDYGLSSVSVIDIIVGLEETFGIEFDDEEMLFENFASVSKIAEIVERKLC